MMIPTQSNQRKNTNTPTKTNALPRTEEHSQTTTIEEKFLRKIIQENTKLKQKNKGDTKGKA